MNDTQYLVSICVPIYGVEKYIERCAISLFEQTYPNIEYIFVNDCTPDCSIEILKSVIEKYPNRKPCVRIITHKKNRGLGAARNTAVDAAKGEFLMHVDSDDWIDKDCIRLCVEKQKTTNADIVSTDILRVKKNKTIVNHIPENFITKEFIIAIIKHIIPNNIWGRLIRTSLYKDNNIMVEGGVNMSEDLNVMPRLAYFARKIATVSIPMYFYECRNQNSYTSTFSESNYVQIMTSHDILLNFFNDKDIDYIKAIKLRQYKSLVDNLINSVKVKGNKTLYNEIRREIDKKPLLLKKSLSLPYKIAVSLKNYYSFRAYIHTVCIIKQLTK